MVVDGGNLPSAEVCWGDGPKGGAGGVSCSVLVGVSLLTPKVCLVELCWCCVAGLWCSVVSVGSLEVKEIFFQKSHCRCKGNSGSTCLVLSCLVCRESAAFITKGCLPLSSR